MMAVSDRESACKDTREDLAARAWSSAAPAGRIDLDPDDVRRGLGKLLLTVVELIRQLLERQAMRRIEAGSLQERDIERLGLTFMRLGAEIEKLKQQFGLEADDLNLDLGPLGKLL